MLSFDDFRKMAEDSKLKPYEKVGFQAIHREITEKNIFPDILSKLPSLKDTHKTVLDIGCGCSLPVIQLIDYCGQQKHKLLLVDSEKMLGNLPDFDYLAKYGHEFPKDEDFLRKYEKKIDVIICYSVLHHIYPFQNLFGFVDHAISLLRAGGQLLIGDIPNITKKKRFLSCSEGIEFHKRWSASDVAPQISWNEEYDDIDDSVLIHLFLRYRSMGLETYILPQGDGLPMNRTREDLLICRR